MREDTADCIAKEMMDDLSLSEDEAAKIAKKIKEEIGRLVSLLGLGRLRCAAAGVAASGALCVLVGMLQSYLLCCSVLEAVRQ